MGLAFKLDPFVWFFLQMLTLYELNYRLNILQPLKHFNQLQAYVLYIWCMEYSTLVYKHASKLEDHFY
jgi:hypothetical protein